MNRTRQILKKTAISALSASMILSAVSTVYAAGSYQETEKNALSALVSALPDTWDAYLSNYEKSSAGSNVKITLKVEDTGRALLGALLGADVSWLQNLSLDSNVSIKDGINAVASSILLNDSHLCDLNLFVDFANMSEYIQIPELSESYIQAPLTYNSEDEQQMLSSYMNTMADFSAFLPDSDSVSALLDRYGNILIENTEEGASIEESISVDGISENCTAYEGIISQTSILSMAEAILTNAKDDPELKSIYEQWNAAEDSSYEDFQASIEELLQDLPSADTIDESTDSTAFSSKVWTNADGKIVGRQFNIIEEIDATPVFTWKAPSDGTNSALFLEISADGSSITLTGSGQTTQNMHNGNYILAIDGVEALNIGVENLEHVSSDPGYYNGTFDLSFSSAMIDAASEESTDTNPLAGIGAVLKISSDPKSETSSIEFTLTTSGAALATLSITGGYSDGPQVPDFESLGETYNAASDESMTGYLESINWDAFLANIRSAGVPEEFAVQLESVLKAAVESALTPEETLETESADVA